MAITDTINARLAMGPGASRREPAVLNDYHLAHSLAQFEGRTLRVRELSRSTFPTGGTWVTVVTADLASAGVELTLSADQLSPFERSEPFTGLRHRDGLVTLEGGNQ